jgi:hypothetical protein
VTDAAKPAEPDAELLEFLGDIDEVNDENPDASPGEDFTEFLANHDIDKLGDDAKKPRKPDEVKDE